MKKKVIVTGGAGFIGGHLVDALVVEKYDVHVIDNLSAGKRENVNTEATLHVTDIRNADDLSLLFSGTQYVFHLAALPRVQYSIENPQQTHEINLSGTLNVLIAAKDAGAERVIFAASSAAYGDQETSPFKEDAAPNPKSPYGLQKLMGEQYCAFFSKHYGLPTVSLRYFNAYGPRLNPDGAYALVLAEFLKLRKQGKPLPITGDGSQTRDFVHVSDIVRATLLAATSNKVGHGEVINIGIGKGCSIAHLAELVGGPIEHLPARYEPHDTLADIEKAHKLLGWSPRIHIEEGMRELLKKMR